MGTAHVLPALRELTVYLLKRNDLDLYILSVIQKM